MIISPIFVIFSLVSIPFHYCQELISLNNTTLDDDRFTKVLNGQITQIEDVPYIVRCHFVDANYVFSCGGSIISSFWILTAAHCHTGKDYDSSARVRTGSSRSSRGGKLHNLDLIIPHPDYNKATKYDSDIMLMKLAKKLSFSDRQRPIKLPVASKVISAGTEVFSSGWGGTSNIKESNEFLRAVILKTIDFNTCKESYASLTAKMVCTSTKDGEIFKDVCPVKKRVYVNFI